MYKHPGVYIEHVPSGALAIEAASTSIAAFVGPVKRGPVNTPVFIVNRGQFAEQFGELDDGTSGIRDEGDQPDYFGHAVNAFYDNGGGQAYVVRVSSDTATAAEGALSDPAQLGVKGLYFTALSPGAWGNKLVARIAPVDSSDLDLGYSLDLGYNTVEADGSIEFSAVESFSGLSMDQADGNYLPTIVKAQSSLVDCEHLDVGGAGAGAQVTAIRSGSLRDLNYNDLKNKVLNFKLNGDAVRLKIDTDLKTFTATYKPGTADEAAATSVAAASVGDLDTLVATILEAMSDAALPDAIKGFGLYVGSDADLIWTPPAIPANTPTAVEIVDGGLQAPLKLGGDATTLDFPSAGETQFIKGDDGGAIKATDYDAALLALRDYRNASVIVMPGQVWAGGSNDAISKAITHSEYMKNRVVIVDPDDYGASPKDQLTDPKKVKDQAFPTSTFSALYYPWLEVTNPHYDADTKANRPRTHMIPPSGFAAGLWARTDGARGVWKAPAGLQATVRGSRGPNILIGNDIQDQLNEWGVNCIRNIIGPPVLWGARTLATKVRPDQRYVPVRRTSIMIGESLYNALQAVVFEPNKHVLWASLRAGVGDFMDGLYRAGAFQGEKASDAYYVRCGLGSTMTQADIDAGIVRVVVGYAPLKPAEFVVVQIKQIVGQSG